MAFRAFALFLTASCLSLSALGLTQVTLVDDEYSCGPGFYPIQDFGPAYAPLCVVDPCYGNPGPCGEGNQCSIKLTRISGRTAIESVCTCNAPSVLSQVVYKDFCYVPGTDRCNPNPCKNGGTCRALADFNGGQGAFGCNCPDNFQGITCELPNPSPTAVLKTDPTQPPTPPPPTPTPTIKPTITGDQGLCGQGDLAAFPQRCWFNSDSQGRYVCCDAQGCDGFNADNLIPHCKNYGKVPPNYGVNPIVILPPPPPKGDQGVCGLPGDASPFPTRCWFNSDPLGRYVCCDNQGCDGFNADNLTPRCKNYGFVPPFINTNTGGGTGTTGGGTGTTGGTQGVCGTGAATDFPKRCWYNNDPMGRYVCCDNDGCNGFYSPDNFFPKCKNNGFVPLNL